MSAWVDIATGIPHTVDYSIVQHYSAKRFRLLFTSASIRPTIREFRCFDGLVNRCLGALCTASALDYSTGRPPSDAKDGLQITRWQGNTMNPGSQYLEVSWSSFQSITKFEIVFGASDAGTICSLQYYDEGQAQVQNIVVSPGPLSIGTGLPSVSSFPVMPFIGPPIGMSLTIAGALSSRYPTGILLQPDWSHDVYVTVKMRTSILDSTTGREQRSAMNFEPHYSLRYTGLCHTSQMYGLFLSKQRLLLNEIRPAPMWTDELFLSSEVKGGDTVINVVTTIGRRIRSGWYLIIMTSDTMFEIGTILSYTEDRVTLTEAVGRSWSIDSRVFPAFPAYMAIQPMRMVTASVCIADLFYEEAVAA